MKMYRVNNELAMNLGSMLTHLQVLAIEFKNGTLKTPIRKIGKVLCSESDCWDLYHEIEVLPCFGMMATADEYKVLCMIRDERKYTRAVANWSRG